MSTRRLLLRAWFTLVWVAWPAVTSPLAPRPPTHMRLAPDALIAELEQAGLKAQLLPLELPDQYMVLAEVR